MGYGKAYHDARDQWDQEGLDRITLSFTEDFDKNLRKTRKNGTKRTAAFIYRGFLSKTVKK